MPEYAYECEACGTSFTVTMPMKEHGTAPVTCPACSSQKVVQKIAPVNVKTSRKS